MYYCRYVPVNKKILIPREPKPSRCLTLKPIQNIKIHIS